MCKWNICLSRGSVRKYVAEKHCSFNEKPLYKFWVLCWTDANFRLNHTPDKRRYTSPICSVLPNFPLFLFFLSVRSECLCLFGFLRHLCKMMKLVPAFVCTASYICPFACPLLSPFGLSLWRETSACLSLFPSGWCVFAKSSVWESFMLASFVCLPGVSLLEEIVW